MTRDPERWLSVGSDSDGFERELLQSIHDVSPRPRAKEEAWTRIAAQMSAVALVTSGASVAATHAAASGAATAAGTGLKSGLVAFSQSLAAKVVLGLAVASAGAFVATRRVESPATERAAPQRPSAAHAPALAPSVQPSHIEPAQGVERGASVSSPAEASEPSRAPAKRAARDDIAAESSRLAEARAELRRGNPKAAQLILSRLRAEFPRGALGQEREVLAIEVLAAEGNRAGAKRRVQAFIATHPNSPHNAALARFLGK
jgi:hypothetical protein